MTIDRLTCPLCNSVNVCGIKDAASCWCMTVDLPIELISQIPTELNKVSCICQNVLNVLIKTNSLNYKDLSNNNALIMGSLVTNII